VEEVQRLERLYEACKAVGRPGNATVERTGQRLKDAQELLDRLRLEHRPAALERLRTMRTQELKRLITQAKTEVEVLKAQIKKLEQEAPALMEAAEKALPADPELAKLLFEYEQQEQVVQALRAWRTRLRAELDAGPPRVLVVYRAKER
jgi:uncharacterized protein involved in exopolysaccharide biosynthesis